MCNEHKSELVLVALMTVGSEDDKANVISSAVSRHSPASLPRKLIANKMSDRFVAHKRARRRLVEPNQQANDVTERNLPLDQHPAGSWKHIDRVEHGLNSVKQMSIVLESESSKLFSILASIPGKKALVLDRTLSTLISSLASFSQLKEHGIESVKWLAQNPVLDATTPSRVIVISRPDADSIRQVSGIIKKSQGKEFTLLLVPRRTKQVEEILQKEGVYADVEIKILPVRYTQEEADLIRVDVPSTTYSSPIVAPSEVFNMSTVLVDLQRQYGAITKLSGKGPNATTFASLLSQMESELLIEEKEELTADGLLGECIVLDRATDLLTPFLTQLTYEGLLYETYPVSGSVLELPSTIQSAERKITLGPGDAIFVDLRNENFSNVGPKLSGTASTLSTELDSRHAMKTTTQLKAFVSRIPNLQSAQKLLKVHIELTEHLLQVTKSNAFRQGLEIEQSLYGNFPESEIHGPLELCIAQGLPLPHVLRLLIVWSLIHNGLKARDHEYFTHRLTQAYGVRSSLALHHLAQHGLFLVRSPQTERDRGAWTGFSRNWALLPDDDEAPSGGGEGNSDDRATDAALAALYSGYVPLSLRLLSAWLDPAGLRKNFSVLLRTLPGGTIAMPTSIPERFAKNGHDKRTTVIVLLGGVTATELSGIRALMRRHGREAIILARDILSGDAVVRNFL